MSDTVPSFYRRLRARRPLVHAVIGTVTTAFVVDVLTAVGVVPSVTYEADEAAEMAACADAVLVNLAQLDAPRREGAVAVAEVAHRLRLPWLLDPAMVDRSPTRLAFASRLMMLGPTIVKPNREELAALTDGRDDADNLARDSGAVLFVTGRRCLITDGGFSESLLGPTALAGQAGYGCALGAVTIALTSLLIPVEAAKAALTLFTLAARRAATASRGPASLRIAFVDALHRMGEKA